MRDVDTIIVSYCTLELTATAVQSVLGEPETRLVIVVDNASTDGSAAAIAKRYTAAPVEVVALSDNRGFGAACNLGVERASAPYVFFLNSDARLEPGGLARLRDRLAAAPRLGVVAPAVHDLSGRPQADAQGELPTAGAILLRRTRHPLDRVSPGWVSGVALMVRRTEFIGLGGFDPGFFLYYEDVDLCRRYRARGLELERVVEARVVHAGGSSTMSARAKKRVYDRSQDLYLTRIGTAWPLRQLVRAVRAVVRAWGGDPMRSP